MDRRRIDRGERHHPLRASGTSACSQYRSGKDGRSAGATPRIHRGVLRIGRCRMTPSVLPNISAVRGIPTQAGMRVIALRRPFAGPVRWAQGITGWQSSTNPLRWRVDLRMGPLAGSSAVMHALRAVCYRLSNELGPGRFHLVFCMHSRPATCWVAMNERQQLGRNHPRFPWG